MAVNTAALGNGHGLVYTFDQLITIRQYVLYTLYAAHTFTASHNPDTYITLG